MKVSITNELSLIPHKSVCHSIIAGVLDDSNQSRDPLREKISDIDIPGDVSRQVAHKFACRIIASFEDWLIKSGVRKLERIELVVIPVPKLRMEVLVSVGVED